MAKQSSKKTILCLFFTFVYGVSSDTAAINVATNGEVTLKVEIGGQIDEVVWKHQGNKMVEFDKNFSKPVEYSKFKGRTVLDKTTGDVTIKNLTKADNGIYEADVLIQGTITSKSCTVEIYDPVTEAKITCNSSGSMATLHCEAKGDSLTYSWSGPGLQTEGQTGPQISKEKDQDSEYTCVVNNPVSKSTVLYHASDCFPSGNLEIIIGVLVGVGVGVGIVIVVGWYFYKKKTAGQKIHGNRSEDDSKHSTEKNALLSLDNPRPESPDDVEEKMSKGNDVPADGPDNSSLNFKEIKGKWHRRDAESIKRAGLPGTKTTTQTHEKHTCIEDPPSASKDVGPNSTDEERLHAGSTDEMQQHAESSSDSSKQPGETGETLATSKCLSGDTILPGTAATTPTHEKHTVVEASTSASKDEKDVEPNPTDEKHQHAGSSSDSSKQSGETGETLTTSNVLSEDQILPGTAATTQTQEKHTVVEASTSASKDEKDVGPNSTDEKHQHAGSSSDSSKQSGETGETLTTSKGLSGDPILPGTAATTPTHEKHSVVEASTSASKDEKDVGPNSTDEKCQHAGSPSDSSKQFGDSEEPVSASRNIPSDGTDDSTLPFDKVKDAWQRRERQMK